MEAEGLEGDKKRHCCGCYVQASGMEVKYLKLEKGKWVEIPATYTA